MGFVRCFWILIRWRGRSNSEMLNLYYHLHDDDSLQTMMELAKSNAPEKGAEYPMLKAAI